MSTNFASLSHSLRSACQASGIPLPLGHAHQLLASAFGYRSLAAYQASREEPDDVPDGAHLILDVAALQARAGELGIAVDGTGLAKIVAAALGAKLAQGGIHPSPMVFFDFLHERLQQAVLDDDTVIRCTAEMNSNGFSEVYLPFDFDLDQMSGTGEALEIEVTGHVRMRSDLERPYRGEQVDLQARITLERWGRRLVGDVRMQVVQAAADRGEAARDAYNGDRMSMTHARAYAELLGLDMRLVEQLDGIEVDENTGSSGDGYYGYTLEFDGACPEHIVALIRKQHGTTTFEVGPGFFEDGAGELEEQDFEDWVGLTLAKIRECVRLGPDRCTTSSTERIMVAFATRRTMDWLSQPAAEHPPLWDRLDAVQCAAVHRYHLETGQL